MSDFCAINKKTDYVENLDGAYKIKSFSRFSATANQIYNTFSSETTFKQNDTQTVEKMYFNLNTLNGLFTDDYIELALDEKKYPNVAEKIKANKRVSLIEVYGIIDQSIILNPDNFYDFVYDETNTTTKKRKVSKKIPVVLQSYDDYLRQGGYTQDKMGKFCSLVPNIFSTIKVFSNFFDNISAIKNSTAGDSNILNNLGAKQLLEKLQSGTVDAAGAIFDSNREKIDGFKFEDTNLGTCKSTGANNRILGRGSDLKNEISEVFSDDNCTRIKNNIEGLISYSLSVFERKDIEEIEFLVYRFCTLIQNLEVDSNSNLMRLKNFAYDYDVIKRTVSASSNVATARATQAGARRLSGSAYDRSYSDRTLAVSTSSESKGVSNPKPISTGDIDGVTPWNEGRGDSRLTFQGRWVSILKREGWDRVDPRAKVQLMRLQARLGKQLILNSGYRSPEYNAALSRKTSGVAKNSYHMKGEACDITWNNFRGSSVTEKRRFIQLAKEEGFSGFGGYDGFIHIDIGPSRAWGIRY